MTLKEAISIVIIFVAMFGAWVIVYAFPPNKNITTNINEHSVTPEYNLDYRTQICFAYFPDGNRTQVDCTKEVLDLIK